MSILATTTAKNTSYVVAFIVSMTELGFNPEVLTLFTILMIIDVITGVWRTYINEGGTAIKSRIGIKGVVSKMMLLLLLFSIAITAKIVGFEPEAYVSSAIVVLALGELYSIVGNIHSARTGKSKSEFDAVAFLLRKIRDILDKTLQV